MIKRVVTILLIPVMYVLIPELGDYLAGFINVGFTNGEIDQLTSIAAYLLLAGTCCLSFGVYVIHKVNSDA